VRYNATVRALVLWSLLPAVAQAQAGDLPARLRVEKTFGAEQCPERDALQARVEGILRRPLTLGLSGDALALDVRFERAADGAFLAHVSANGSKPGQRLLRDTNLTCDALGEAVSVAIALLLDSALTEANDSAPAQTRAPVAAAQSAPRENRDVAPVAEAQRWRGSVAIEAGGSYGLGGAGALLGIARLGAARGSWFFDVGAGGNLPTERAFDGGAVRTSLVFAGARGCFLLGHRVRLGPCLELGLGRLHGEGRGYGQAQSSSLPWIAGGLGLAAQAPLAGSAYVGLATTLWVPTRRQTFSVENAGIAWESKPIAGLVTAGLGLVLF